MEELENNNKGCLIPSHTNSLISLFCVDQNCQQPSRILCQQCLMNRHEYHKTCDSFLTFEDSEQTKLNLEYSENSKLKDLLDWAYRPEEQIYEEVNQIYKNIQKEILRKLEKHKKETKVKMQQIQQNLKEKLKDYLSKQKEMSNLHLLQQDIIKFRQKQISLNQFNEQLQRKQQQNFTLEEKINFLNIFQQIKSNYQNVKSDPDIFQDIQKSLENSLKKTPLFPQILQIQNLELINGCNSFFQKVNNKYIKSNNSGYYLNFQSEFFKRDQHIQFTFKLYNLDYTKYIYLGVIPLKEIEQNGQYYFNFNQGNEICFSQEENNNNFYRGGKKSGMKQLYEVCTEGQTFILKVCIEENLILLKDEKEQCVVESTYDLKNKYQDQDWVIVIGDNSNLTQNFTIEVL